MGLPSPLELWMPSELADCWREPFARAWFEQTQFLDHPFLPEPPTRWWRTIQGGGVLINYPCGKVLVEIFKLHIEETIEEASAREVIETWFGPGPHWPPVGWWVRVCNPDRGLGRADWDRAGSAIADDVCRILLASGCLSSSEVVHRVGRSIYLCCSALCSNWDSEILPPEAYTEEKELLHPRPNSSARTSNLIYSRGVIRRGLARLIVHTGPAIDPQTRAARYYIALVYRHFPLLAYLNETLHLAVSRKLTRLGCQRISIPELGPRKSWQHYFAIRRGQ
jgi:hypothetical protein